MNETEITDVVLTVLVNDHELGFPKFLVVRDLVMVLFTFSDLEDSTVSIKFDLDVLKLGGINTLELEFEGLLRKSGWSEDHFSLLEHTWGVDVLAGHILKSEATKRTILGFEVFKSGVVVNSIARSNGILSAEDGSLELCLVETELMLKSAVAVLIHGFTDKVLNDITDNIGITIDAEYVVFLCHKTLI